MLNLIIICSMSGYGTQNYPVIGSIYTRVSEEEELDTRKIGTMDPIVCSGSLNQSYIADAWFYVLLCTSSVHVHVNFSSETLIYKKAWLNVQFSDAHTHSCCLTIYDLTGHFLRYLAKLYSLRSDFCHPFFVYIIGSMPSLYVLDTGCDSSPFPLLIVHMDDCYFRIELVK